MNKIIVLLITLGSLVFFCQTGLAFLPGEQLKVTLKIVINPVEGAARILCDESKIIGPGTQEQWWLSMHKLDRSLDDELTKTSNSVKCGSGVFESPDADSSKPTGDLHSLITGNTSAGIITQMQNERVVKIVVKSQLNVPQISDNDQNADLLVTNKMREFKLSGNEEVFIPLFLANPEDQKTLGVREVFMRVAVEEQLKQEESIYGTIWLSSDSVEADVLLDGGVAGKIPASGELYIRNVRTGLHEVSLRTSEGIQMRKSVDVIAGRTMLARLELSGDQQAGSQYELVSLQKNIQGYEEFQRVIDEAVVIKIPEGEFLMGNSETERSPHEHKVYLSSFLMDKTGVTWGQFKLFAAATGIALPPHNPYWGILEDHPAAFVTWEEAGNYCHWAGGRLPTEAEREKAARGSDGRMFPWGNEEPRPDLAVFRMSWGYHSTAAVGQHPKGASPYGLLDVGGNVWEWCADWYDGDYYQMSPYRDPKGPASGIAHVVRGGSWDSRPTVLSSSCRNWGHLGYRDGDFGFRCAMNSSE